MTAPRDSDPQATRTRVKLPVWAPWGFGLLVLVLGAGVWEFFPPGVWHDDGVYVLTARALAQGDGLRYHGVVGTPLAGKFPPLFSAVLAGAWLVSPEFPANNVLLGGVNLLLLGVSAAVFLAFLIRCLALPHLAALGVVTVAWLSPALWRVALVPLSEPLFLLLLTLSFWAALRLERRPGGGALTLFLLAAGSVFYTRTIGVALLVAAILTLALKRRNREALGLAAGSILLVLPWAMWSRIATASLPEPLRDTLGSYGGWWIRQVMAEPGAFVEFLPSKALLLGQQASDLLAPTSAGIARWVGVPLLALALVGLWESRKVSITIPLTLLLTAGTLLVWPFQDIRLLVPYQPFLILGVVFGYRSVSKRWAHRSPLLRGGRSLALVLVAIFVGVWGFRLASGWPGSPYRVRAEALGQAVRAVEENTAADAVVGAPELWSGIHLFTGRAVMPSARFLPLAQDGPSWGTPAEQYALWAAGGLDHVLVEHGGGVHGDALDRVDEVCRPGTVEVLDIQPGQFLVRLNWAGSCRDRLLGTREPVGGGSR